MIESCECKQDVKRIARNEYIFVPEIDHPFSFVLTAALLCVPTNVTSEYRR